MKICFVAIEEADGEFFDAEFRDADLQFCRGLDDVESDVEALSVFITSKIDARFLDAHPKLKLIATRSTTHDHIDLDACGQRNVQVCGVGSYGDHTVTEHTFALILALCRRLRKAMENKSNQAFSYESLRSIELHGKTFATFGAGRIGRQTLRLAGAFGMKLLACDLHPDGRLAREIGFEYVDFDELLRRADIISLNTPLTPETFHLFNRDTFAKCRRGVIIINTARGRLIDSAALIEALDAGIVGGAGLDVIEDERVMRRNASQIISDQIVEHLRDSFGPIEPLRQGAERIREVQRLMENSALLTHANVVFTPHIAFNSVEAIARINRETADNIKAFAAGAPRNIVTRSSEQHPHD